MTKYVKYGVNSRFDYRARPGTGTDEFFGDVITHDLSQTPFRQACSESKLVSIPISKGVKGAVFTNINTVKSTKKLGLLFEKSYKLARVASTDSNANFGYFLFFFVCLVQSKNVTHAASKTVIYKITKTKTFGESVEVLKNVN